MKGGMIMDTKKRLYEVIKVINNLVLEGELSRILSVPMRKRLELSIRLLDKNNGKNNYRKLCILRSLRIVKKKIRKYMRMNIIEYQIGNILFEELNEIINEIK